MKKKNKILVLSDLSNTVSKTLRSSISLAKILDAEIHFFYIKKPTEVVEKENQLSAKRAINKEYFSIDKKMQEIINPISTSYSVAIKSHFAIGNVKNEIENYIQKNQPDIVVLGKRQSKKPSFLGDNIIRFVLKKHKGIVVISDDKNPLDPNKELLFGLFNTLKSNNILAKSILESSKNPLTTFNISNNKEDLNKELPFNNQKEITYVLEKGNNTIKNISTFLTKSKVDLLFINRNDDNKNTNTPSVKDAINKLDCSIILTT